MTRQPSRSIAIALALAFAAVVVALLSAIAYSRLPTRVVVHLLAINDLHGTLEPSEGGTGRIDATPAGGVEYLATHLARLRAANPYTLTVSAGDNIGASPLLSSLFHDEPAIETLDAAGLDLSSVGNHEFDEGWRELLRIQYGGCRPVDGCGSGARFRGARFQYLAANVLVDPSAADADARSALHWLPGAAAPQPILPAYAIREIGGVKIGFIGLVLHGASAIVSPAAIRGVRFLPEAETANALVPALERQGVRAIVVLIHEGGHPAHAAVNGCDDVTGPIVEIARDLSPDIGVIVSGHSHEAYVCEMSGKLVTSASSFGRVITDITISIDRATDRVVNRSAANTIVARDVEKAPAETSILDRYRPYYAPLASRVVGSATDSVPKAGNAAGESALGDLIADAQLEAGRVVQADVAMAFMNVGGLRADLVAGWPDGPSGRPVTYESVFAVQPFGNTVQVMKVTGDVIRRALEQQFTRKPRSVLQVSQGFTYRYDLRKPDGEHVDAASIRLNGQPIDMTASYTIVANSFLADGGDGFDVFREGTDRRSVGSEVQAFAAYIGRHSPVAPGPKNRIVRVDPPDDKRK
jgi:5'-nucleotidase